jgi:hypothetical protein
MKNESSEVHPVVEDLPNPTPDSGTPRVELNDDEVAKLNGIDKIGYRITSWCLAPKGTAKKVKGGHTFKDYLNYYSVLTFNIMMLVVAAALDIQGIVYKINWVGPRTTYSFLTGSTSYLNADQTAADGSLVRRDVVSDVAVGVNNTIAVSGWPSFLHKCEGIRPFTSKGDIFFLSAMGTNCQTGAGSDSANISQLVMTSDIRVDAVTWSSCRLLVPDRRPGICNTEMVTGYLNRYMWDWADLQIEASDIAIPNSDNEKELLAILDVISSSSPMERVTCVEAFELPKGAEGNFTPNVFGCASPNVNASAFIGYKNPAVGKLIWPTGWLTNDMIHFMGFRFDIRQDVYNWYFITNTNEKDWPQQLVSYSVVNFSSYGELFGFILLVDFFLLALNTISAYQIFMYVIWPQIRSLNSIRRHGVETEFSTVLITSNLYRSYPILLASLFSDSLSWFIIIPNSVIWTWSDRFIEKAQATIFSFRLLIVLLLVMTLVWDIFVKISEKWTYWVTRRSFISVVELISIGAIVAAARSDTIFYISGAKWQREKQRVNDLSSFQNPFYLAHSNTFMGANEYEALTKADILWVIYKPVVEILLYSMLFVMIWVFFKLAVYEFLERWNIQILAKNGISMHDVAETNPELTVQYTSLQCPKYARLPLEELMNSPIRARTLVRNTRQMEVVKNEKNFILPEFYMDYGIFINGSQIRSRVMFGNAMSSATSLSDYEAKAHAIEQEMIEERESRKDVEVFKRKASQRKSVLR